MANVTCLVGLEKNSAELFRDVLPLAGAPPVDSVERFNVSEIGVRRPAFLVFDFDEAPFDRLEFLRQIRFVVPECVIAVYTGLITAKWSRECHLAGASCLLSKSASATELIVGIREVLSTGCYTDPSFEAA